MLPRSLAVMLVLVCLHEGGRGQAPELQAWPLGLDSGVIENKTAETVLAWSDLVQIPGVEALQLRLGEVELAGPSDAVVVRSLLDGEEQVLDQVRLSQWQHHSAWFNGSQLLVSLRLGPFSRGRAHVLQALAAGPVPSGDAGSCPDNRVTATTTKVCRFYGETTTPLGTYVSLCTGFLVDDQSTVLSAGHCHGTVFTAFQVAEFNVPSSTSTGAIQHPGVADQYPVDASTVATQPGTATYGDDWAVLRLHPNSLGQTAASNQGWLTLASSIPTSAVGVRIPGYGSDTEPTKNNTLQKDSGTLTIHALGYLIVSGATVAPGGSGGPIIRESNDEVLGIFTDGSCAALVWLSQGTPIDHTGLQAALANLQGCTSLTLDHNSQQTLTCTPVIFDLAPEASVWNAVGVSSSSDWDIRIETVSSTFSGDSCDFLLANGHQGTVAPVSGRISRVSGSSNAAALFTSATSSLTVGNASFLSYGGSSSKILRVHEFQVSSAGTYDIAVLGTDPGLDWGVYEPGTSTAWISRGSSSRVVYDSLGTIAQGVSLNSGWHALVLSASGGDVAAASGSLVLAVWPGTTALTLATGPQTLNSACRDFVVSPTAGTWHAAGVTSPDSNYEIHLGSASSRNTGTACDFVVASGHAGSISSTVGLLSRSSGSTAGRVQAVGESTLSLGTPLTGSIPEGEVLRVHAFEVTAAGTYDVFVGGEAGPSWHLFAPASTAGWMARSEALVSGAVGGEVSTGLSLGTGWHALVIARNGGASGSTSYDALVCAGSSSPLALVGLVPTTVVSCTAFTISNPASSWAGVALSSTDDWDLYLGGAASATTASPTEFLVANGNVGTPTESGVALSSTVFSSASLDYETPQTLTLGAGTSTYSWTTNRLIEIFQFEVVNPGLHAITLSGGSSSLRWYLYEPGSDASWRNRSAALMTGLLGGTPLPGPLTLQAGWYALVVVLTTSTGVSTSFTVGASEFLNPLPTLTSISPVSAAAGAPGFTLTAVGTGFIPSSELQWDGSSLATTMVGPGVLQGTVAPSLLAAAGVFPVTVFNPSPGGGTSAAINFVVEAPVPVASTLNPAAVVAGNGPASLVVGGSGFAPWSVVRWDGVPLSTTYISDAELWGDYTPAHILAGGSATIDVDTPAPGGGTSSGLTLTILEPVITTLSPSTTTTFSGTSALAVSVTGQWFLTTSVAFADGVALTTTYGGGSGLFVDVPGSLAQAAWEGGIAITVANTSLAVSNTLPLVVGGGANQGIIRQQPLDPGAGDPFSLVLEGGVPGAPLTLFADLGNPSPVTSWPNPLGNFVLGVGPWTGSAGPFLPLLDGLGIGGTIFPFAYDANGRFQQGGFVQPSPPAGVSVALQALHFDPASPLGIRLTWTRYPLDL